MVTLALALFVVLAWSLPARADIVASVLPSSRSVTVGAPASAFAAIINAGTVTATDCRLVPRTSVPASFAFQTTDPTTNRVSGPPNTAVSIPPGGLATFVFAFTPTAAFDPVQVRINFTCSNTPSAPIVTGLNTLLLSASTTPVPDVIALAATTSSDGRVHLPAVDGAHAFAVATANVGAAGTITVTADDGGTDTSITVQVCQTNPSSGACLAAPASSVTTSIAASATPTFAFFVRAIGAVAFDPAHIRVFVRFRDPQNVTRGSTSVAVNTPPGDFGGAYSATAILKISGCRDADDNAKLTDTFTFALPPTRAGSTGSGDFSTTATITGDATLTVSVSGTVTAAGDITGSFEYTMAVPGGATSRGRGNVTGTATPSSIAMTLSREDGSGEACRFTLQIEGDRLVEPPPAPPVEPPAPTVAGSARCVRGTVEPPPQCLTYPDVYSAQADSDIGDEVRIYGIVPVPRTLTVRARKLIGVTVNGVRGTLDGRSNPGTVVSVTDEMTNLRIEHLDVLTSGMPGGIGIAFSQSGQVTTNGLAVIGPAGGKGIGIDLRPGVGRVTMYGQLHESVISGQDIGIRAVGVAGRPSPNGLEISDVRMGIQSMSVPLAQWFTTSIRCKRPGSIGFLSVAEHADHNGLDIGQCSVGIQIECLPGGVCGQGNEWDFITISTSGCPDGNGCVPVRVITDEGPVDDYRADPNCGDVWGIGDFVDGQRLDKFPVRCPGGPTP